MSHDFVISAVKVGLVEKFRRTIEEAFDVRVAVEPVPLPVGTPAPSKARGEECEKNPTQKWIRLTQKGETGNCTNENLGQAKACF